MDDSALTVNDDHGWELGNAGGLGEVCGVGDGRDRGSTASEVLTRGLIFGVYGDDVEPRPRLSGEVS